MPPEEKEGPYTVEDFADFLAALSGSGLEVLVIGGCAVGAYAALRGEKVFSRDLDVYTTLDMQLQVMEWAPAHGAPIVKRPQPRALPGVSLDWKGKEVNVLTETKGFPPPAEAFQEGRVFRLKAHGDLSITIADPYDLLRCKLELNRPKDMAHQQVLRRFLEEEVVKAFQTEAQPRDRIAPAQRLLEVLGLRDLPDDLAVRLLPHARIASDFRFLMGRAPAIEFEDAVLRALPQSLGLREEMERIRRRRRS